MAGSKADKTHPSSGTIIRAENGDILGYDSTGMVMILSDRVIADIARRLPKSGLEANAFSEEPANRVDADVLGNIDAWDVRQQGEWYYFTANAPGKQGVRKFQRLISSDTPETTPSIIAEAPGPVRAILSLGGARRATGFEGVPDYPWHVLAPADEIGAVGYAGTDKAVKLQMLQTLTEMTRDAALADVLLTEQHNAYGALNLHMVRTETDNSASIADLADGIAYQNIMVAAQTLQQTAVRLGKSAGILAFGLDFTLEDIVSDANTYKTGMLDLMAKLSRDLAKLGLRSPPFLAVFDCGTHLVNDSPVLRAQAELSWQGSEYGLCYTAPGYMFKQDPFGRPDIIAVWQMAEMESCALKVIHKEEIWMCPTFLLAEREAVSNIIRVRARAMTDLVIDKDDPFASGDNFGFSVAGATNKAKIVNVAIADDDPQDILLTFDKAPSGKNLKILYAFGNKSKRKALDYPLARGAVRDSWAHPSRTGKTLHRWALPTALPVH